MLEMRALEIWDVIDPVDYDWPVGNTALKRLSELLQKPVKVEEGEASDSLNRRLRILVGEALNSQPSTADLYEWIVCNWGGVWAGREEVRAWAELGWCGPLADGNQIPSSEKMVQFADQSGSRRISSWSKIFAYAEPDQHAIYDSRVAVALNIALHRIGEGARFHMPESQIYRPRNGPPRPNAVARARRALRALGHTHQLGYGDYLVWAKEVREQLPAGEDRRTDLLAIETRLFSAAPQMADDYLRSLA